MAVASVIGRSLPSTVKWPILRPGRAWFLPYRCRRSSGIACNALAPWRLAWPAWRPGPGPGALALAVAVMVNLLGDLWFDGGALREPDWPALQAIPELRLHLYGKNQARPGRKMGHFTVLGSDLPITLATAMRARRLIGVRDDSRSGLA